MEVIEELLEGVVVLSRCQALQMCKIFANNDSISRWHYKCHGDDWMDLKPAISV